MNKGLTARQVSKEFNCHISTIFKLIKNKKFEVIDLGKPLGNVITNPREEIKDIINTNCPRHGFHHRSNQHNLNPNRIKVNSKNTKVKAREDLTNLLELLAFSGKKRISLLKLAKKFSEVELELLASI